MTRFTIAVMALALLLVACSGQPNRTNDDDQQTDGTPTAEPTATERPETAETVPDEDPRDVVTELMKALAESEHRVAFDRLVPEFQALEFDPQWVDSLLRAQTMELNATDVPVEPEAWRVEEHRDFVVVRDRETPRNVVVLRPDGDEWRWDPGDNLLVRAWIFTLPEDFVRSFGMSVSMSPDSVPGVEIDAPVEDPEIRPLQYHPLTFVIDEGNAELTVEFSPQKTGPGRQSDLDEHLFQDTIMPLDGLSWRAGDESGPIEVAWTNARLDPDTLVLPALRDPIDHLGPSYTATFSLIGLPQDVQEITVHAEDIQVGPLGEDAPVAQDEPMTLDIEHTFAAETTDEILLGEVPDVQLPDVAQPDEQIPHEELPPSEIDDVFDVAEMEYERADDEVRAFVRLETSVDQLSSRGASDLISEGVLTWEDGHQSDARILSLNGALEFRSRRNEPPFDLSVREVSFDASMARHLEPDQSASLHEDRVETKWGDFPILDISEVYNGNGFVHYQTAGRRRIEYVQIEHEGERIGLRQPYTESQDQPPEQVARLGAGPNFLNLVDELPISATVQVVQYEDEVTLSLDQNGNDG